MVPSPRTYFSIYIERLQWSLFNSRLLMLHSCPFFISEVFHCAVLKCFLKTDSAPSSFLPPLAAISFLLLEKGLFALRVTSQNLISTSGHVFVTNKPSSRKWYWRQSSKGGRRDEINSCNLSYFLSFRLIPTVLQLGLIFSCCWQATSQETWPLFRNAFSPPIEDFNKENVGLVSANFD